MKYYSYSIIAAAITLCSGCGSIASTIDYAVSEYARVAGAAGHDHTLADAWLSGTGGKALTVGNLATWAIGNASQKDVSEMKAVFRNATDSLIANENFNKSDVHNWFGGMLCMGDELLRLHRTQQAAKRQAEDEAWEQMIQDALNGSRHTQAVTATIDRQAEEYSAWLEDRLARSCGMTVNEYNTLFGAERSRIDMKMLEDTPATAPVATTPMPDNAAAKRAAENTALLRKQKVEGCVIDGYAFDSADLSDGQKAELEMVGREMEADKAMRLFVTGHTCSIGSENSNRSVGLKRAETAKAYLMEMGIEAERILTESAGSSQPVAPNTAADGRSRNRRITFRVMAP